MSGTASFQALASEPHPDTARAPITVDWKLGFARAPTRLGLAYWQSLCGSRTMPRRDELKPQPMRSYLAHVNLIDVKTDDAARADYMVSLQGQHAQAVFGCIAHKKLDEALPAHIAERWRNCFDIVHEAARPVRFASRIASGSKLWLDSESLLAPLGAERIDSLFLVFVSWPADRPPPPGI
jgi:hypothetical protein